MENAEMKKLPEAVTTKFTELFAALHSAADDLKMITAEACLIGDFSQVTVINDSCRKLQALESEIQVTLNIYKGFRRLVKQRQHKIISNKRFDYYRKHTN
jgi:hypothetical protein